MIRGLVSLFVVGALSVTAAADPGDPMPQEEKAPAAAASAKADDKKFEVVNKDAPVAPKATPDKAAKHSKHKKSHKARKHKKSHRKTATKSE
ncbi:MAG: hypothetical protein QM831_27390 [Kofleriaceae bacterium]